MSRISLLTALVIGLAVSGCTSTTQTAKLAQGPVLLAVNPVKADVKVDTTHSLLGMSSTTHILGFIRFGDHEFADYPGISFGIGGATREKRSAIYQALEGTEMDVLVNPKFIVRERRAILFRKTTVQVAGFGGKFVFE
ncbi:MAG: hypothetical protein HOH92_07830 [Crocinitomicaceae bacterium]|jgi:hypothetical protein|nr:hypothetical protein [Crocinitomicaceae bacterium]